MNRNPLAVAAMLAMATLGDHASVVVDVREPRRATPDYTPDTFTGTRQEVRRTKRKRDKAARRMARMNRKRFGKGRR